MSEGIVGSAIFELRADVDRLRADMSRARQEAKQGSDRIAGSFGKIRAGAQQITRAVGTMTAAFALAAGARGLLGFTRQSITTADTIGKTARKLGVTTGELQEFRFAASQASVETRTLDIGLQRFLRRAAEAKQGTGEAKNAIRQLGIEFTDAAGKATTNGELFSQAISRLGEIEDAGEQLRLAFKLFDSEGVALVNLANGFEETRQAARDLGIVIDRDTIAQAEKLDSQLDLLSKQIDSDLTSSMLDLAPILVATAEGFRDTARAVAVLFTRFKDIEELNTREVTIRLKANEKRQKELREEINSFVRQGATSGRFGSAINAPLQELTAILRLTKEEAKELEAQLEAIGGNRKQKLSAEEVAEAQGLLTPKQAEDQEKLLSRIEKRFLQATEQKRRLAEQAYLEEVAQINATVLEREKATVARSQALQTLESEFRKIASEEQDLVRSGLEEEQRLRARQEDAVERLQRANLKASDQKRRLAQQEFLEALEHLEKLGASAAQYEAGRVAAAGILAAKLSEIAAQERKEIDDRIAREDAILERITEGQLRATGQTREIERIAHEERLAELATIEGREQEVALAREASASTYAAALQKLDEEQAKGAESAAADWERVGDRIEDSITNSLTNAFITGEISAKSFGDTVLRIILNQIIGQGVNALASSLASVFSGGGGIGGLTSLFSLGGGGGGVSAASAPDGLLGNGPILSPIPGLASGGRTPIGRPVLVGERGPELAIFGSAGSVVPNDQVRRALGEDAGSSRGSGGGEVKIIVNNYGNEDVSVQEGGRSDQTRELVIAIGEAGAADLAGRGPLARTIENVYGLKRTGRRS